MATAKLNQIALSVVDVHKTDKWFREAFEFLPAGGTRSFRGPGAQHVQGLPGAASTCWWLNDRNDYFQIELFQFEKPIARLMPADYRPCDIGYSRIGLWVRDFDAAIERLNGLGSSPSPEMGDAGKRRSCVRSPDGVFVEIMEDDPLADRCNADRADCPVAVRSVTLSVPDLEKSRHFFEGAIGLSASDIVLHGLEHESMWGLDGATSETHVLDAGPVLLELVKYQDPIGNPWPDGHRISDQGILNIAFGFRNMKEHMKTYRRTRECGAKPNGFPLHVINWGVVYVNDEQGFSVELLWVNPRWDNQMGFKPKQKRPPADNLYVEKSIEIDADPGRVWDVLSRHAEMPSWFPADSVTITHPGVPAPNGVGALRHMVGSKLDVSEQVTSWQPSARLDYRLLQGAPLACHQGNINLSESAGRTTVTWRIRCRPKIPGSGFVVRRALLALLDEALPALKCVVEAK